MVEGMEKPGQVGVNIWNTLRFLWRDLERETFFERLRFNREILVGHLGLKLDDVRCVQRNHAQKCFDVSLETEEVFRKVEETCRRTAEKPGLKNFWVRTLWRLNYRVITVHVFNPFLPVETIAAFLARYVDLFPAQRKMRDEMAVWIGKRQFQALLCPDPVGYEGLLHPLASFNIGSDRGYFLYARQPKYCRRCQSFGHLAGHIMRDCLSAKTCSICGEGGTCIGAALRGGRRMLKQQQLEVGRKRNKGLRGRRKLTRPKPAPPARKILRGQPSLTEAQQRVSMRGCRRQENSRASTLTM